MPLPALYQRVLIKISGEALSSEGSTSSLFDKERAQSIAIKIEELQKRGVQIAIVIGGGNIFRGAEGERISLPRVASDQVGMLSTIINGIVLQQTLHSIGCKSRVLSALEVDSVVDRYSHRKAVKYLERGEILILVAGLGHPFFTTDTAAALRASEIGATLLIKATKVDAIYDQDPLLYPGAKKISHISYSQMVERRLAVIDATAVVICQQNKIPIRIVKLSKEQAFIAAVCNKEEGSLITGDS